MGESNGAEHLEKLDLVLVSHTHPVVDHRDENLVALFVAFERALEFFFGWLSGKARSVFDNTLVAVELFDATFKLSLLRIVVHPLGVLGDELH